MTDPITRHCTTIWSTDTYTLPLDEGVAVTVLDAYVAEHDGNDDPSDADWPTWRDEKLLRMEQDDFNYEWERLSAFLDGDNTGIFQSNSPAAGNALLIRGSAQTWTGTSYGYDVIDASARLLRWLCAGSTDIVTIEEDTAGSLFITGVHHDGATRVEVRQFTDDGLYAWNTIDQAYENETFTIHGHSYTGEQGINRARNDVWDDPTLVIRPCYLEHVYEINES